MALRKKKTAPVEEEVKVTSEEVVEEVKANEEIPNEEVEVKEICEEKSEEKKGKVVIKEEELKMFNAVKAPEEVRKIIAFYGVTSTDLFTGNVDNMWLKADELKILKEWYATLA